MPEQVASLRHKVVRGAAVLGVAQAVKIGVQLASVVVLSRLLTPDDFGVTAAVAPLVAFMMIFQDFGLQQAIVQRDGLGQRALSDIFWLTVLLGAAMTVLMMAFSPLAALFFHDPRLRGVSVLAAAPLLAYALAAVPAALLNRDGHFKQLALVDIVSSLVSLSTAVAAALLGARYWSLPISAVVTALAACVLTIGLAGWRPAWPRRAWPDAGLLHFGGNLTGFTLVNFLARNADNLLVGHASGSIQLGYYDRAYKLLLLPLQTISYPLGRVMIPLLSRMAGDEPRFRDIYLRVTAQLGLAVVPGMAALVATAPTVVAILFGPRWAPVTPIFFWLGLAGLIQPINSTAGWIFISQARTQSMFRLGLYTAGTTVASFAVGLRWGAAGVAAAYAISEYVLRLPVQYWWIGRVGPVRAGDLVSIQAPLLAAAAATWFVSSSVLSGLLGLGGFGLVGGTMMVSYALAVLALAPMPRGRAALRDGASLLMQSVGRGTFRRLAVG